MIEAKHGIEVKDKEDYPVIPEDIYAVELIDVSSEENETYDSKKGKTIEKEYEINYTFEFKFLEGYDEKEKSIIGTKIQKKFVKNYYWINKKNIKNDLFKITEAFLGKTLSLEDVRKLNIDTLNGFIGKQIRVGIEQKESEKGVYCNIDKFLPAKFEPTSKKEADTTNPDDHHLNADKNPIGQDVPVIDVDDDDSDISLDSIPF